MAFRERRKLTFGDVVKFAAALLAALGLGRVVDLIKKRRAMSDQGENQRREQDAGDRDEEQRLDAAAPARRDEGPAHTVGEGPPRDAAIDAASDIERMQRLEAEGAAAAGPHTPQHDRESDIAQEQRGHSDLDAALQEKIAVGYETEDARVRPILTVGIVSAIFLALVVLGLYGLFNYLLSRPVEEREPASALNAPTTLPPEPRLQVDPPADWQALRATEEARLTSYDWVDQKGGAVRIPIDRAIDLLAQRGLPVRSGTTRQYGAGQQSLDSSGGQYNSAAPPPNAAPAGTPQSQGTGGQP